MASEYKIAIHIAGELEKSFGSSIQGAQQGIASLAGGKIMGGIRTLGKVAVNSMVAAGAAIGAAGVYSVNTGREFEAAMSSTAATAGASAEEYERLRDAAMEMGRTTSKTATESAQALEYMSLAGWSVDDSIASLPGILRLSEASGMDLARTSDLVTDSMSATGTEIGELDKYLDICARAQNKSNQTAEQMMEAYIGVGGVMNNLGVPLTESGAALGVLANRGIKGSEAGTALNAIMTNLTTGAGQAGKAMEAIGVSAFDSDGNFIGLEETLRLVNDATKDMTEEERNATLAAIGGKHHLKDLNALMAGLNETNEEGVSEWNALEGELKNSTGALEEMAQTKLDNLNGDLAILTSSLQDLGIRAYDSLGDNFRGAVQWATDEVYKLSDAMNEGGFDGFASTLGEVLSDGVVQIANYAPQFVDAAATLISSFLTGIDENADQIGEGAAKTASSLIIGLLESIPKMVTTGLVLLASFLLGIEAELPQILQAGKDSVNNLLDGIGENLPDVLNAGIDIILQLQEGITQEADNVITKGSQILGDFLADLGTRMPELITSGTDMTGSILQGIVNGLPYVIQGGLTLIAGIGVGIIQNLDKIIDIGINVITSIADTIVENLPMILAVGGLILLKIALGIAERLPDLVDSGMAIITKLAVGIVENLPMILGYGAKIIGALAIGLIRGIGALIRNIPHLIGSIVDAFFSIDWASVGKDMLEGIKSGFIAAWGVLVETVTSLWEDFKNWMGADSQERIDNYIEGYVQAGDNSDKYTADNGQTWHTSQELADMGIQGAAEVAQNWANAPAASEEKVTATDLANKAKEQASWVKPDSSKYIKEGEETGDDFGVAALQGVMDSIDENDPLMALLGGLAEDNGAWENQLKQTYGDTQALVDAGKQGGEDYAKSLNESVETTMEAVNQGAQGASLNTDDMMSTFLSGLSSDGADQMGSEVMNNFYQGAYQEAPKLAEAGTEAMNGLNSAVESGGAEAAGTAQISASQVVAAFEGLSGQLFGSGRNAIQGFANGMNSMAGAVQATAASIAQAAADTINNALKIGSPSKLLEQTGAFTGEGFAQGLAGTEGMIREAASDAIGGVTGQSLTGSRSSVIGSTMQSMNKQITQPESGSGGTATITYAPTYQINGSGLTKDDVVKAGRITQSEFEKMMKQYTKNKGRLAFA